MDWFTDALLALVSDTNNPVGLAIIGGSAMVEYIFPPFPGDTITLAGAVLITAYGWSFFLVFAAVLAGSIAGSMLDFYVGTRIARRRQRQSPEARNQALEHLIAKFQRHGAFYLVINRFLPGIRALFFVAAGMAGMRALPVMLFGALSAALWNLAIIGLGAGLGVEFESMKRLAREYSLVMWSAIALMVLFFLTRGLLRRRRQKRQSTDG